MFSAALIKKGQYWPKHEPGESIKSHFLNQNVGDIECWHGILDGIQFHLLCTKGPDYIIRGCYEDSKVQIP